jgi:hypothetical protein
MAPHLSPGSGDPVDAFRAKMEADRRRTRNKVLTVLGALVLMGLVGLAVSWYFDPERALAAERPRTEPIRAQYCKILEAENARLVPPKAPSGVAQGDPAPAVPAPKVAVPDAIRPLGFFSPDYDKISHENPRGNADTIELGEIAWLCGARTGRYVPDLLYSNFTKLYETEAVKSYQRKGVQRLVAAATRLTYVVVARKKTFQPSVVNGENTMQPGHYAAQVMLYRLSDAALLAEVTIDEDAPGIASVYVHQDRFGNGTPDEINAGLDSTLRLAFEGTVQRRFKERGVDIALGYDADK